MMKAYVIVDVKVHDTALYDEYKKLTPSSLVPFEGKFMVRGGAAEVWEGEQVPGRVVVIEFPSAEKARAWYNSENYKAAMQIRQRAAHTQMILVEGVE